MANVSSSNGLEKYPKLRFPCFDQPYTVSPLSNYLFENTERNRDLLFDKEDVLSVSGEFGVVNQIEFQGRSFAGESVAEYHVVNTNEVVYTKSPLKANPYGIIKTNKGVPGIVSTLYAVYHPKECVDPLYVEYYFGNDLRLNKFLKPLVNIGAKHDMKVNNEFVLTGEVCFPSVIEQQKVVEFLSCLDRRIEKQRTLVEHLKKYKRGVSNSFFNDIVVSNCSSVLPFGRAVEINPKTKSLPSEFIYIDLESVESGKLLHENIISRDNAPSRAQRVLSKGDVLFQMVRPYQKNNFYFDSELSLPSVASTGYAQIRCGDNDPLFVFEQISSDYFANEAMLRSTGTGYPAINADSLAEIPFIKLPIEEQQKIGKFLYLLSQRIIQEESKLDSLLKVKSAMLQSMFI